MLHKQGEVHDSSTLYASSTTLSPSMHPSWAGKASCVSSSGPQQAISQPASLCLGTGAAQQRSRPACSAHVRLLRHHFDFTVCGIVLPLTLSHHITLP